MPDDFAYRYLTPIIAQGPQTFVRNVICEVGVVQAGDGVLPFTVTEFRLNNSYICSPYNHYVTYASEELRNLKNPLAEHSSATLIRLLGHLLNPQAFDRVVMVNNWLLSTNLYQPLSAEILREVRDTLRAAYPHHALLFRSVDSFRNAPIKQALERLGFGPVWARQVWYQQAQGAAVQKSRDYRNDLKLLRHSSYEVIYDPPTLSDSEIERIVLLYNQLYLEKYAYHNPQFTPTFVRLLHREKLMRFTLLVQDGRIDGVYATFAYNGVMAQPILGYDTSLPQEIGLYRLLSVRILLEAQERGLLCHASAGVGRFKQLRGGIRTDEYTLVYDRHLPPHRRRAWALLRWIMERVAVPIIRRGEY